MSMMVSFVLSFFPRDVLDEILNLIESVSEDFPSYSCSIGRLPCVAGVLSPFSIIFSEIIGPSDSKFLGMLHR